MHINPRSTFPLVSRMLVWIAQALGLYRWSRTILGRDTTALASFLQLHCHYEELRDEENLPVSLR
jgi:hypothetical protein